MKNTFIILVCFSFSFPFSSYSYIQSKNAFDIYSKQYIIQPDVGFDYVQQYYVNPEQDTMRETSSRIWQRKSDTWVVTHMQVSRQAK